MSPRRSGEEKRDNIKRAAYECFRDYGYHDASVDQICERAGISKGSFYWHYPSKQDVYIELLESWAREMMDQVYEQFEEAIRESDYVSALRESLARETKRGHVLVPLWLEFTVLGQRDPEIRSAIARFYRRGRSAIAEMYRPRLRHTFSDSEISALAMASLGAYTGVMMQSIIDPESPAPIDAIDTLMKVVDHAVELRGANDHEVPSEAKGAMSDTQWSSAQMEHLLSDARPPVRTLFREWLDRIRKLVPAADEHFVHGWKTISWGFNRRFVSLRADVDRIRISFHEGVELEDPENLIHGNAKHMRFLVIRPGQDVDEEAIFELVRQAAERAKG
jgi:AcrR family transcriptional regulator